VYNSRVATHIKVAIYNIKRWQRISQPYIVLAADKAYGGYRTTKHYVIPLWAKTKVTIRYMLVLARAQRRQFVDPHVARIWEKVKELSRGKAKVYTMPSAEIIMPSSVATSVPESLETVDSHSVAPSSAVSGLTAESAQSNAPTVFESPVSVEELDSVVKPTPPSSTVDGGTPPINISEGTSVAETKTYTIDATESLHGASLVITETLQSVSSVIAASAHETAAATSSVISSLTDEVHSRFSSVIASGREPFATPVPSARGDEDVNIDLNSFYAELGLHDLDDGTDSVVLTTPPVSHESETEEEKGERLRLKAEQTAKKRADIIARHVQWEEQLGALINDKQKELRKALVVVRKSAVTELKESADMRARVEGFVNEAEKFLKGAEVYLKNLEKELRKVEEKMSLWQRVVGKVETKFSEKLRDVENFVNGWYMGIIDREMQAVGFPAPSTCPSMLRCPFSSPGAECTRSCPSTSGEGAS
jgi:hypothetical protein